MRRVLPVILVMAWMGCSSGDGGGSNPLPTDHLYSSEVDAHFEDGGLEYDDQNLVDHAESNETPTPPGSEYPTAELMLKITGPSGNGYGVSSGSIISVTGIVFSPPNTDTVITWKSVPIECEDRVDCTTSGGATGAPFWQTDEIALSLGDNFVTVTAQNETETVSESVLLTYNPGFVFQNTVNVRPPSIFVGDNQEVFTTIALGLYGNLVGDTLALQQVNKDGKKLKELGIMEDNGVVGTSGDEINKDGVFTLQINLSCPSADPLYVRAKAHVKGAFGVQESAYSSVVKIDCVNRLPVQTCGLHVKTLANARTAYINAKVQGLGQARQAAFDALSLDAEVQEIGSVAEDGGLWVMWKDGVLGALNLAEAGMRGNAGDLESDHDLASIESPLVNVIPILSRNTMLLSPYNGEFGDEDETQFIGSIASKIVCPNYNLKGPYNSAAANLNRYRSMSDNGIVAVATHGYNYFKSLSTASKDRMGWSHQGTQEILWTGEAVDCGKLMQTAKACSSNSQCPAGTECMITQAVYTGGTATVSGICHDATQVDLMTGRVVLGDKTYGITPAFVLNYGTADPYPQSLVYLGACRTLYNGSLAAAFFASGARTVAGYSNSVTTQFANQMGSQFFDQMIELRMQAGKAYGVGAEDPSNKGSFFRLFGSRHLDLSQSDILNPSFETGDLTAWDTDGDGRVIAMLGPTGPVSGKFMAIISTGLGFTVKTGNIEQTFCIPQYASEFSFFWKFYSEEFHEWCGSQYQDTFKCDLVGPSDKEHHVVNLTIDDLCCPEDCLGCGSFWAGDLCVLKPADPCDQGDNYTTDWQKASFNVSSLAGGPVTLRFFCTDKGDSIYDTVVLVDHLKFE